MSGEPDGVERIDRVMRWAGRGAAVVLFVAAGAFSWIMAGAFLSGVGAADAAPRDLCSLVASEQWRGIVPAARVSHHTGPRHDVRNDAECEVTGRDGEKARGRYGRMHAYLDRHGATRYGSGWEGARKTYDWLREDAAGDGSTPREVRGLGEQAFAEARSAASDGARAEAEVTVLLGRDVLTIEYAAEPSSPERAREVAVAVATTMLAKL
ncbi:hypothetical protein [Streptomyces sp. S.PNR 29]|uniref:hypothetical protein n=1 Tax=Streptomyces sp. S.PNR 29 TaxID=2973805 RepID=UPI0025B1D0F1|nr:hypothetical protein [Streptomyces sp. S.PNR 29]MDN0198341.1 hypothetical protein [Streptomyces sp. S.PNR 29]